MLKSLKVLNGDMPLKFDPFNTTYTIQVLDEVMELELEYKLDDGDEIEIIGNHLTEEENKLTIRVKTGEKLEEYSLIVYKVQEEKTLEEKSYLQSLELSGGKEEMPIYVGPLIASICFVIIVTLFTLLFKKQKNKKKIKMKD